MERIIAERMINEGVGMKLSFENYFIDTSKQE